MFFYFLCPVLVSSYSSKSSYQGQQMYVHSLKAFWSDLTSDMGVTWALSLTLMDSWSWNPTLLTFASGRPLPGLKCSNQILNCNYMPAMKIPPQPVAVRVCKLHQSWSQIFQAQSMSGGQTYNSFVLLTVFYFLLSISLRWSKYFEASQSALDTV